MTVHEQEFASAERFDRSPGLTVIREMDDNRGRDQGGLERRRSGLWIRFDEGGGLIHRTMIGLASAGEVGHVCGGSENPIKKRSSRRRRCSGRCMHVRARSVVSEIRFSMSGFVVE